MRILWLPHHHWRFIRQGQREYRLAQAIKDVHDIHFLTWLEVRTQPTAALEALRAKAWTEEGLSLHQARRLPNFVGQRVHESSARGLRVNELLHQRAVRELVRKEQIDLVICGISHQSVGLPPDDLDVPLAFDYLDYKLEAWPEVEAAYMRIADAAMCTSQVLVERVQRLHPYAYYLPNGVDLRAAAAANATRVRAQYNLDGATVVSLIGVTASSHLFYVDGIAAAARDVPDLVFLLVGDGGALGDAMIRRARELGLRTVATGPIPPSQVADFFAATDVGLYPGDQTAYFDAACPLKVLEYSAAGKPVVATDLAELRNWSFPNVRLARPTANAFAREIKLALKQPHERPDLDDFSWSHLSSRLLAILAEIASRGKVRH
jgi:glycosyltransferase involved in cell wall biosynthesis